MHFVDNGRIDPLLPFSHRPTGKELTKLRIVRKKKSITVSTRGLFQVAKVDDISAALWMVLMDGRRKRW